MFEADDRRRREARLTRLRRVAAELGITLAKHPQRDLAPLYAKDWAAFDAALEAHDEAERARIRREMAEEDLRRSKKPI